VDDALAAVAAGRQRWPDAALWLAGFSFGGTVALRASVRAEAADVQRLVTVAPALGRSFADPADIQLPACPWLIVQGDADEVIDGALVIDWARRIAPAASLAVIPDTGHFFHGQLAVLQQHVQPFLEGVSRRAFATRSPCAETTKPGKRWVFRASGHPMATDRKSTRL